MPAAKLHINLTAGVLDVEGDVELVREIYSDFKDRLVIAAVKPRVPPPERQDEPDDADEGGKVRAKSKRKSPARKRSSGEDAGQGVNPDVPKLDRDLDTSKLASFYGQYAPKNHPEKILVFLTFLTEEVSIESPNTDQVFTCYNKANERIPKAFAQAFRDTSGRTFGYIDYKSATDIRITTAGLNHFRHDLKKKGAE